MLVWLRRSPHASKPMTQPPTTPLLNWVSGIATTSYKCVSCTVIFHFMRQTTSTNTGGRPTPSRHISRPAFDAVEGQILEEQGNAPQTKANVRKEVCFLGIYVGPYLFFFRHCYEMDTDVPSVASTICSLASILMKLTQPPRP